MGWLADMFGGPFFIGAGVGMNRSETSVRPGGATPDGNDAARPSYEGPAQSNCGQKVTEEKQERWRKIQTRPEGPDIPVRT
jgi:hypothetical protein